MMAEEHVPFDRLIQGLEAVRGAPEDSGVLSMIVRRPATDEREVLEEGELDCAEGLKGDLWRARGSRRTADGSANPEQQITLMNARAIALVAGARERWPLAGDQLYVDLDLSEANLPAGTRLAIGDAVLQISAQPHTGCRKFADRYGMDAVRLVNSEEGARLRLRGVNARVVRGGAVRAGDTVRKVTGP